MPVSVDQLLARRALIATVMTGALALAVPAQAEIKGLEIIAPAGPGGGYDQLARATQEVLQAKQLASGVQVQNIPGAGGTIGLAQFVTKGSRSPSLLVAGLGLIGAIATNKSPVTLEQVQPLARLTGEYQPLVVAADSPIKSVDDLLAQFKADPGSVSWGGFALGSPDHILCALIVKAAGGDVAKMNYIVAGAGGEMLAQVMGGHLTVATGGLNEMAQQIQTGKLRAIGISSPERLPGVDIPDLQGAGCRRDTGELARPDGTGKDAPRRQEGSRPGDGRDGQERPVAGAAQGARLGRHVPAGRGVRGVPRAGACTDRGHSAGSRADPVDREDRGNDDAAEPAHRRGGAGRGGARVWALFIAIETAMLEVAAANVAIGPRLFPFLIAVGLLLVGAAVLWQAVLRPHRARARLRARLAGGGAGLGRAAAADVPGRAPGLDHRDHAPVRRGDAGLRANAAS